MSPRFQLLFAGTIIFIGLFFWLALPPHTNTAEEASEATARALLNGLWALAVYASFSLTLIGHEVLNKRQRKDSSWEQRE